MNCPCGHPLPYEKCCAPFHDGTDLPATAEALMRSRYSAYALKKIDYIFETTDPQTRSGIDRAANEAWAREAEFLGLEVIASRDEGNKGFVEFKATYRTGGETRVHHEKSRFRRQQGRWYFRDGTAKS
ncbi:MAG: YchJ family protein [Bdellovibrionaceae bacterium]|nr:YchJ family protein [Pseudobdellovibrionaceae bacterium]MBX3033426.1 YchJ family protein [Pseudobdellovibrionaceae bacterium]